MQFHLIAFIVVSIFLETRVSERPIATKKDFISMYHGALVRGFVNMLVYVNNF